MKNVFILTVLLLCSQMLLAQITPQQAITEIKRGINIGNTLDPPDGEGTWNNGPFQEYYFDDIKEAGFTVVRLPVTWYKHIAATAPYKVDENWMNRVEQIVDWGLSRGLYIILNAHHEESIKTKATNAIERDRFDSLWSQISVRFKNKSPKLMFEILNEPNPMALSNLNPLNVRVLAIIRKTNQTRLVVFSGTGYTPLSDLKAANIPDTNDKYLIGNFHSYNPWSFISEGGVWGNSSEVTALKNEYTGASAWSTTKGIPVMVNECGVTSKSDYNSRMFYLANVVENALNNNVAFCYWDDGGSFEMYLRNQRKWNDNKDVLIYTYKESPTKLKLVLENDTNVTLTWQNRTTLNDSIIIEKRAGIGENFTPIAKVSPSSTQFKDIGLNYAAAYYYRVRTNIKDSISLYSYPQVVRTKAQFREPFSGQPLSIPGIIEAENYDKGGEGLTYHDTEESNKGGVYRPNEDIDIEALTAGGFQLAYNEKGEWIEYTINVADSGSYKIDSHIASMDGGGKFNFIFKKGDNIYTSSTVTAPKTSSWQTSNIASITTSIPAGILVMRVNITSTPSFNLDKFEITKATTINTLTNENWKIYPNPASNFISIKGPIEQGAEIEIMDLLGQSLLRKKVANSNIQLDLEEGTYFVKINGIYSQKLIIKK